MILAVLKLVRFKLLKPDLEDNYRSRLKRFKYEQVTRNLVIIVVTNIKVDIPSYEAVVYISHPS